MKLKVIIASIKPWNGIKVVRLDLEKVVILKYKSKDDNNDNLTDISEPSESPEPFNEPSKPSESSGESPESPANESDAPDESDVPEEFNDIEIDEEYYSEETAAEKRPDDRLRQKETHFASKYVIPKIYRAA
jgi:hypothetical protein